MADRKTLSGNVEFEGRKLTAGCLYYLALREPDYTIQNRQLHSRRTDSIAQQLQSSGYETYITENCLKGTLLHRAVMAVA